MRGECPDPIPECRYAERGGCFSDTDHIVPQRLATTALAAIYIDLPVNKQQLCRRIHDQKTAEGDEPLPDVEVMRKEIQLAHALGEIALSRRKMKAVYGRDWKAHYNAAMEMRKQLLPQTSG